MESNCKEHLGFFKQSAQTGVEAAKHLAPLASVHDRT